jgi:hypothetical protein
MAIQIEEIRAAAATNAAYSGNLNGELSEFYRIGGGSSIDVLEDLEPEWLRLMGYPEAAINDKWNSYLADFGFTGVLLTNLQNEANARHLFPQAGTSFIGFLQLENGDFLLLEDGSSKILLD